MTNHKKLIDITASLNRNRLSFAKDIGVWAGGAGGLQPPPPQKKLGQLRFFGQEEKSGQSQFLKKFACVCVCCFFSKRNIF